MKSLALVTGAASGLGLEFATLLAADSYDLILVDINERNLKDIQHHLESEFGIRAGIFVQDLGKPGAAEAVYAFTGKKQIDVLINNAGFGLYGPFAETAWKLEESMIYLHIITLTQLTKLVLNDMIGRGSGKIMNISSLAAFQAGPLMSIYFATKAFILSFSEALANEVQGTGVTVTAMAPGWFKTNFQKTIALNSNVEESQAKLHTTTTEKVARKGYKAMHAGKTLVIPGFRNKLMSGAPRILPRKLSARIIRRIQERVRKQVPL